MKKTYVLAAPDALQVRRLQALVEDCRSFEPLCLGFPDDGDLFLFTCDGDLALSCIIVCRAEKDLWECYAFTRPDWRRRGLFRELLEKLCQIVPDEAELSFLLDHRSPDALAAFSALEMDFWRTEIQMECSISSSDTPSGDSLFLWKEEFREEETDEKGWLFSACLSPKPAEEKGVFRPDALLGSCCILFQGQGRFYLCRVEIIKKFRNQGWGTRFIQAVKQELPANSVLYLHVSSENTAAVRLYKKTGFHIAETLSYYFY